MTQQANNARIKELEQALCLLMEAYDALLPGAASIVVDIGLLNEAACTARPLVDEIHNREK